MVGILRTERLQVAGDLTTLTAATGIRTISRPTG